MFLVSAAAQWALLVIATAIVVAPAWWLVARRAPRRTAVATADARPSIADASDATAQVAWAPLLIAALVFFGDVILLSAPRVGPFVDLAWNWQGKLLALAAALVLVAGWRELRWRDVGVTRPGPGSWLPALAICAPVVALAVAGGGGETRGSLTEALLFQATMPGLEEELVFRGILWALVDRALPGRRTLWGAPVGWALVVTTVLFGVVHGVVVDDQLTVTFQPALIVFTGVLGFAFGWLRARTGSILPAIVLHNVVNVAITAAA